MDATPSAIEVDRGVERRVVLHGISWEQYEAILAMLGESPGVRLAYLEGALEIMSPSDRHEGIKTMIARLLEAYSEEQDLFLNGLGSTTFRKRAMKRGVEPDECYVLSPRKGGRALRAPDLAIEIVLSWWDLDKLSIYAGLGVKELWLYRNDGLEVHVLRGGKYRLAAKSRLLPKLDLGLLVEFVGRDDQVRAVKDYRAALRRLE